LGEELFEFELKTLFAILTNQLKDLIAGFEDSAFIFVVYKSFIYIDEGGSELIEEFSWFRWEDLL